MQEEGPARNGLGAGPGLGWSDHARHPGL